MLNKNNSGISEDSDTGLNNYLESSAQHVSVMNLLYFNSMLF